MQMAKNVLGNIKAKAFYRLDVRFNIQERWNLIKNIFLGFLDL